MLKKIGIVIGIILLVIVIGVGVMMYRLMNMAHKLEAENAKLTSINLSQVKDGIYFGRSGDFVVMASVEVTVKNHKITKIAIVDQKCGPGYEARDIVSRIIKTQSPKVDTVTGASSSSRAIMNAVDQALKSSQPIK